MPTHLTVQDLINELIKIEDKTLPVLTRDECEENLCIVTRIVISKKLTEEQKEDERLVYDNVDDDPYTKGSSPFDDNMGYGFTRAVILIGNN